MLTKWEHTNHITNIKELPDLDPLQLIGFRFVKKYNGLEQTGTVKDWTNEGKFITRRDELATYNNIINKYNQKNKEGTELHVFTEILDHKKKGNKCFIQIKWNSGKITWEPIKLIKGCDSFTLAKYAYGKNITDFIGWKWAKSFTENPQHFIRLTKTIKAMKLKSNNHHELGV